MKVEFAQKNNDISLSYTLLLTIRHDNTDPRASPDQKEAIILYDEIPFKAAGNMKYGMKGEILFKINTLNVD